MSDLSTKNSELEKKPSKMNKLWDGFSFMVRLGCILFFAGFILVYSLQEFADIFKGLFSFLF